MAVMSDEQKIKIAHETAKVLFTTMAGVPPEIQLEASLILVRSQFIAAVKPTHRLSLFNAVMSRMKKELKEYKEAAANGKT